MTQLNTDLTDLSDVTDEAIEAAIRARGVKSGEPSYVRSSLKEGKGWAEYCILLARAIQLHPDMIVDPVTKKAREICAAEYAESSWRAEGYLSGQFDDFSEMRCVKRALAGMAMERGE